MLLHDVAIQGLHVVFCVDRAGLVGEDGETHHGIFDVGFLDTIPGMTVLCPASYAELKTMLAYAVETCRGPVAVRYPRGGEGGYQADAGLAPSVILRSGRDVTLVGYGTQINALLGAAEKENVSAEVIKLNSITPLDPKAVLDSVRKTGNLLVAEESANSNCVGVRLTAAIAQARLVAGNITLQNLGERFPTQGSVQQLRRLYGLDADSIAERIEEVIRHEKAAGPAAL